MASNFTTGFGTRVSVGATTFREVDVTPMGLVLDPSIEQSSNANTAFASFAPGDLITKSALSFTCKYDADDIVAIKAKIAARAIENITVTYKDGSTDVDKGWIVSFAPDALTRGSDPTATVVVDYQGEDDLGVDNQTITPAI